ncbi:biotin--[acetyl-CoA-carboxylase] ligase [Clostridium autoethanogenum]|uniref:Bifunctional ligase/repressor BirA n=1 Tax=Clostridium autoethanogenum TaxID=84023 RepID=A0A3M0SZ47_9CLOT|nr:biotin--[acetyl-CoA-carboxylase] ligase [Clostridium autoethanogenum]RMD03032.1 biotin--[acetyl-CoA-carboxylase] ligase [Clostridium autoethanogenum]
MKHYEVLYLLKENRNDFVSGQLISEKLGVSRTAIWKYIKTLKEEGYTIDSSSKKGYKLISSPDILTSEEIKCYLNTKYIGKKIIHYESIGSTNTTAKKLAEQEEENGTIIIAEEQTAGRGRIGRTWSSPKYKSIYFSIILRPNVNPMEVPKITQIIAAAIIEGLKELKIEAKVKWPNDIVIDGKKVCGILTEMSGELNKVNYVIPGIGINVNLNKEDFQEDILNKATSLKIETGSTMDRKVILGTILNKFEPLYEEFVQKGTIESSIEVCKNNSAAIGKNIRIIQNKSERQAKAVDLAEDGRLIVQYENGSFEKLISGEISIRGLDKYI